MNFWDSSAIIAAHDSTSASQARFDGLLRQKTSHAASRLIVPEVVAGLARRNRQNPAQARVIHDHAMEAFDRFSLYSVTDEVIDRSLELAGTEGLKGADAVHIATALLVVRDLGRKGFVLVTLDKEMAGAARRRGLRVIGA